MIPTDDIRTALNTPGMNADDLKKLAVNHGMSTLYWDAMEKVRQGITTLEEALSKVRPDEFESKPSWWNQEVSESHLSVQS
jgi:type IV pilus assembly protein PilB